MTMNLAVWFQHILAGNNHELAWEYGPLAEEVLKVADQGLNDVTSQVNQITKGSRLVVEIPRRDSIISTASHAKSRDMSVS
ncbi:hypothetical protein F4680DRAFT_438707 [Xylaria scruposa]|nr:hypothetical protein F4680DRAFT_438707 [Xylaria scruposa]